MNDLSRPAPDLITVRGLNSTYHRQQVLFDISFGIPSQQITVIMGVSGCGKTTLLRHLIGLKPTGPNQVLVDGRDLGAFTEEELRTYRRRIGVLFQSGALFNSMSVVDNIAVPLKVHTRLADETIRIMALIKLKLLGLADVGDYMPSQLSGGMRKRAALARALALDPPLLLCDEPTSGLDPMTTASLDELIVKLRDQLGITVITVSHDVASIQRIAEHVVFLDKGRLLFEGSLTEAKKSGIPLIEEFFAKG